VIGPGRRIPAGFLSPDSKKAGSDPAFRAPMELIWSSSFRSGGNLPRQFPNLTSGALVARPPVHP